MVNSDHDTADSRNRLDDTDQLGRRIQMWIDHHALFAPITKASFRLEKGKIVMDGPTEQVVDAYEDKYDPQARTKAAKHPAESSI